MEAAEDYYGSSQPRVPKARWNSHSATVEIIVRGGIRNCERTALEAKEEALDVALERASRADVAAAEASDWAQTAAAKIGKKMEERMVSCELLKAVRW